MSIAPANKKILESCHKMMSDHLTTLVDRMFANTDAGLLDFAEKAESNAAQAVFFEAMNEVRKKRPDVERCFHREVRKSFDQFPEWAPQSKEGEDEADEDSEFSFSLVKDDTMEEDVAIKNILTKNAAKVQDNLNALVQRLSFVNDGDPISEQQIPAGPVALAEAFRLATHEMEMDNKVRLVILALFDKFVMGKTSQIYSEYNALLVKENVLPKLKYKIHKSASTGTGGAAAAAGDTPEAMTNDEEDEQSSQEELGSELFGTICQFLSQRHTQAGAVAAPPAAGGGQYVQQAAQPEFRSVTAPVNGPVTGPAMAPAETLVGSINQMQNHVQSGHTLISSNDFFENIQVDENLVSTLQQTLFEERQKIFGAVDRRKIPTADSDVIDLVGMLFEYMLKEDQLPNIVKALISRLHTPMLKVAIIDRRFFTQSKHPARRLMNDMIAAGIRWVNDKSIDTGIFPKMRKIVEQLLADFAEDVEVFELARIEFGKIAEETRKRSEIVEQRTNEAANGQEKLLAARNRAQQETRSLLSGKALARASCNLLIKLWTDKMIFILLREPEGDQSEAWHNAASMARKIVASAAPPSNEEERIKREAELEDLQKEIRTALNTTQHAEKEALLLALFKAQQEVLAPNLDEMPAEQMVETPAAEIGPEVEAEPEKAVEMMSTEEKAALEKITDLPFGTWFEFRDEATGKKQLAKLSWRSTITQKYMFVDQMGVKSIVISMTDLASALVKGNAEIIVPDKKPFVDRALGAIHRMLDRGVAATA